MDPKEPKEPGQTDLDGDHEADQSASEGGGPSSSLSVVAAAGAGDGAGGESAAEATTQLGTSRYVHAAFLASAVLIGFVTSRLVVMIWNRLAEWPLGLEYLPFLVRYDEDVRGDFGLAVGALVGVLVVVRLYSKPKIRVWSSEVATELSKVTWPDRDMVTRGTIIVIVASLIATVYVTILDRLWGFTTGLVYAP
jgi:preprotein translocase subunit SecE